MPPALHHWRALGAAISGLACLALTCSACGSNSTSSHLGDKTHCYPAQLSGGQRQRVSR